MSSVSDRLRDKVTKLENQGMSREAAYREANPVSKRWTAKTFSREVNRLFESSPQATLITQATPETKLRKKQETFCREFMVDLNGKQAAIRAGYSPKTADQQASRLLSNVKVKMEIERLSNQRDERVQLQADDVVRELMSIAFAELKERGVIKPGDKLKALELLGKHQKLFTEKVQHTGLDDKPIEIITGEMSEVEALRIYRREMRNQPYIGRK
jgi:phage terminase small subunit